MSTRRRRISFPLVVPPAVIGLILLAVPSTPLVAQTGNGEPPASDTLDSPPPAVPPNSVRLGRDTVWAAPGEVYPAGPVHRALLGDLNRDLWHLEFPVPVLDLDSVGGGLTVDELSGGKQTLGLRFRGADGFTYQFRSILKTASRAIPSPLRSTEVEDVLQDQMAAQFPLSAMVVAELLDAAGVLVARPRPVVMPDDPRLGEFRDAFAGRMGWIEIRPNERETEDGEEYVGFAGSDKITGSEELYEELIDDPESYVDARQLLRARLIDMLVGDWDRHSDQWRWASYPDGQRTRWEPIPRDRDWALSRIDGLLPRLTRVYMPKYRGFDAEPPDVLNLHWSAQRVDRTLLSGLDRDDFEEVAAELVARLDDEVLDRAVGVLPESYQAAVGADLRRALGIRRDALPRVAREFYRLLAGWVDVPGTEETDSVRVEAEAEGVRVTMWAPREGDFVRYDRWFDPRDTRDIRIYLRDGDDVVVSHGELPIPVRVVGASGDDRVVGRGVTSNLFVYEGDGRDVVDPRVEEVEGELMVQDSLQTAYFTWDTRDWGHAWVPRPEVWFDSDIGLYAGAGLTRYGFGFGNLPYHSRFSVSVLNGFDADQWIVDAEWDRALGDEGWRMEVKAQSRTDEPVWLYGFGNGVEPVGSSDDHRAYRSSLRARLGVRYRITRAWTAGLGPEFAVSGAVQPGGVVFDSLDVYGAGDHTQLGMRGDLAVDTRDSSSYPRRGRIVDVTARIVPSLFDVEDTFGGVGLNAVEYLSAPLPGEPTLHLRVAGEKTWGRTPFFALPFLGGAETLPGFTSRRFIGNASLAGTALLRLKLFEPTVLTDLQAGVHAVATSGRVWYDGSPDVDRWHSAAGGGLWVRIPAIDRVVGLTLMRGDEGVRAYLDFGFLF